MIRENERQSNDEPNRRRECFYFDEVLLTS